MRVVFTADARLDLSDILIYTEQRWGKQQRREYQTIIRRAIDAVASNPHIGTEKESLPARFKVYRAGHHILYYRVHPNVVELMRILHERMDPSRHL